ncbi:MAG: sigma-70 family RNA polymerase sigma factor, partial [Bacteroidales bacterium]|nr:sigma-70 family RNA polymerase sigma factor [Bacteroidales bacterium]
MQREIDVLKHCQNGSSKSFALIVERYQALVCAITFASTSNWEKSEELAQETFLLAWKNLRQLRDLSKFKPWLCQIARNVIQNWRRTIQRDVIVQASELEKTAIQSKIEESPADHLIQEEEEAVVRQAMEAIPEKYRLPLILFYREDKSNREVAHIIGLSEVATRQRIARARGMLKEQVSAMVENTLIHSKPGKAFTGAVIASIAGSTLKGTATATAAGLGIKILTTSLPSLMTKATIIAAGLVVVTSIPYLIHRQQSNTSKQTTVDSSPTLVVAPNRIGVTQPHPIQESEENKPTTNTAANTFASLTGFVDKNANPPTDNTSQQQAPN